jgi:hypothetical protein
VGEELGPMMSASAVMKRQPSRISRPRERGRR